MMKNLTYLMMVLMLLATGCKQQSREEILIELQGRKMMKKVEKDGFDRIKKFLENNLEYPESYQPIDTEYGIVTNHMILYDSDAFLALQDLNKVLENFHQNYGDDSTSEGALKELSVMRAMADVIRDKINEIDKRPLQFEGIDVYHQFYVNDLNNHQVKKGYHFIFHKDKRMTLHSTHDNFLKVQAFAKQLLNEAPYVPQPNSIESKILSR